MSIKGGAYFSFDNSLAVNDKEPSNTAATANDITKPLELFNSGVDELITVHYRAPSERPVHKLSVRLIDTYKHINKVKGKIFPQ